MSNPTNMRNNKIVFFVFFLSLLLACGKSQSESGTITVEPKEIKLGIIFAGKQIESQAIVKNTGTGELTIKNVRSNCECVLVNKYPKTLQANKSDTLKFSFIAPTKPEQTKKTIYIETSDKAHPIVELPIYANIVPPAMESTFTVLAFQCEDKKYGYEIAEAIAKKAREFPQLKMVRGDELVQSILNDQEYKTKQSDEIIRKWGEKLGIRYIITGQVLQSSSEKTTVLLVIIDSYFAHPILRKIEGRKDELLESVPLKFAEIYSNIEKIEKEITIQSIQAKWAKKRSELIGKPAKDFALKDVNGKNISLSRYRNKVLVVHFFSVDCEACEEELGWLKKNSEKPNTAVLGISVDEGKEEIVRKFISEKGLNYPIIVITKGDSLFLNTYYTDVTPQTIIIDKSGIIRESMIGFAEGIKTKLDALIDELQK